MIPPAAATPARENRCPFAGLSEPANVGLSAGLDDFPRDPLNTMRSLYRSHGDAALVQSQQRQALFVFSPPLNREVLTQPDTFRSLPVLFPGPRQSAQRRLAMSLVAANGQEYKQRRRVMLEPLKKNLLGQYLDDVVTLASEMLASWRVGEVRDVSREMQQLMLRVTSGILFGLDQPQVAFEAGHMLDQFLATDSLVGRPGVGRLDRDPATYDRLLVMAKRLEQHIQQLIDHRRGAGMGADVLSRLLTAAAEGEGVLDDARLIGDVAFFFGAAHKTTASALVWTLFLLAQHPAVAADVHAELLGKLDGRVPTAGQLEELPLLDRVLRESLRLLPPVVCMGRQCAEETRLAGHTLGKGALVMLSQFITHRREDLYANPERFDPNRWLSTERTPFEYLPFSSGARRCLGAEFSQLVLKTTLSMILQRFRPEALAGSQIDYQVTLVLEPKGALPMVLRPSAGPYQACDVQGSVRELVELPAAVRTGPLRIAA